MLGAVTGVNVVRKRSQGILVRITLKIDEGSLAHGWWYDIRRNWTRPDRQAYSCDDDNLRYESLLAFLGCIGRANDKVRTLTCKSSVEVPCSIRRSS